MDGTHAEPCDAPVQVVCEGRTVTATRDFSVAEEWCSTVMASKVSNMSLDCEWSPPWYRGDAPERICVIQLATETACLVFNVVHIQKLPEPMVQLLKDETIMKFGVNVQGDCTRLERDFDVEVSGWHDLISAARLHKQKGDSLPSSRSLGDLVKTVLHRDMEKAGGARIGDWSKWPLSESQVLYAALDVCLASDVFLKGPDCVRQPVPQIKRAREDEPEEGSTKVLKQSNAKDDAPKSNQQSNKQVSDFYLMMRNKSIDPPQKGKKDRPQGSKTCLNGLCFVVSGVLDSMDRKECHEYIEKHGGSVAKSLTKKVTHLLNDHGEVGPAKKKQALQKGIPIVGEDVLFDIVRAAGNP
eukprot:350932-Prorocentrum_minimum.AAC.4